MGWSCLYQRCKQRVPYILDCSQVLQTKCITHGRIGAFPFEEGREGYSARIPEQCPKTQAENRTWADDCARSVFRENVNDLSNISGLVSIFTLKMKNYHEVYTIFFFNTSSFFAQIVVAIARGKSSGGTSPGAYAYGDTSMCVHVVVFGNGNH